MISRGIKSKINGEAEVADFFIMFDFFLFIFIWWSKSTRTSVPAKIN